MDFTTILYITTLMVSCVCVGFILGILFTERSYIKRKDDEDETD